MDGITLPEWTSQFSLVRCPPSLLPPLFTNKTAWCYLVPFKHWLDIMVIQRSSLEYLVTWRNSGAAPLGSAGERGLFIVTVVELQLFKTEGREPLVKSLWCSAPNLSWWACHSVLGPQFERLLIHLVFGKPHWVIGQNAACSCLGSGRDLQFLLLSLI